jgi:hypothetical protein
MEALLVSIAPVTYYQITRYHMLEGVSQMRQ